MRLMPAQKIAYFECTALFEPGDGRSLARPFYHDTRKIQTDDLGTAARKLDAVVARPTSHIQDLFAFNGTAQVQR